MKLLKNLRSTLLFSILLSVFIISNAYSADDCTDCPLAGWGAVQTRDIVYPEYPGCTVRVTFKLKGCNNAVEVLVQKISYIGGTNCSSLYAKFGSPNYADQLWLFDRAYDILIHDLFLEDYLNRSPLMRVEVECPNGQSTYRVFKGACVNIIIDTWSYGQYNLPRISWYYCDDIACCKQRILVCYNTSTNLVETTEIDEYTPSEQDCTDSILPPPPPGATQTGCIPWCQNND